MNSYALNDEVDQRKLVPMIYQIMSQIAFAKLDKPSPIDQREQNSAQVINRSVDYILNVNELLLEAASNQSDNFFSNQDILVICSYLNTLRSVIFSPSFNYHQKVKNLLSHIGKTLTRTQGLNVKLLSIIATFQKAIVEQCKELGLMLNDEISREQTQNIYKENRPLAFRPSTYFGNQNSFKLA